MAPEDSSIGPARVRTSAPGGWLDGCVAIAGPHGLVATWERLELHPCGTIALASVTSESTGVAATDRVTSSWLGAGSALVGVVRPLPWLGLGVRAEALIPFGRERFVVIGAGTAYAQAPVAALLGGGIVIDVL